MGRHSQADRAREIGERAERELGTVNVNRRWLQILVISQLALLVLGGIVFFTRPTESKVRNIVRTAPPACRDMDPDKDRVKPSPACRDIALLILRQCRAEPRLCFIAATAITPAGSRRLVRREVTRQLRRPRRTSGRSRSSGGTRSGSSQPPGSGNDNGGATSSPPSTGGSTQTTGPAATPSTPTPAPSGSAQPTPGGVVDGVLGDPVGSLTSPSDTINETVCAVGVACDQPIVPPLPPLP